MPALSYVGNDSFNYQVSDGTLFSADATMAITVTSATDILVQNGSFETSGTALGGPWFTVGSPWTITSSPSNYQVIQAVAGGYFSSTDTGGGTNIMLLSVDDCPIAAPFVQNLSTAVSAGDTLSVTFSIGKATGSPGGTGVVYFDVAGTKYTMVIDTTGMAANSWQTQTFTQTITNSGNLRLGFYSTSIAGHNSFVDKVSNISVTPVGGGSTPTITDGTLSGALSTTYGTASNPATFTFAGANMTAGILVTAPTGCEVSQASGSGYAASVTVGAAGTIASTTVYVRLAATAAVGSSPYSGNITCVSSGATTQNVATVSSTVSKAGSSVTVTGTTSFTYTGSAQGPSTASVTGSTGAVTYSYSNSGGTSYGPSATQPTNAGSYTVTATVTADSNYNTASSTASVFSIGKATPTATLAVSNSPTTYDGTAKSATVGITSSAPAGGSVTNISTGGATTQTAAGTYAVTANFVPTDTANYTTLSAQAAGNFVIDGSYTSWASANNVIGEANADSNQDGVPNGIAYFMNATGRTALPGVIGSTVTWTNGGNIPSSSYGSQFVVQTSSDLVTWTPVAGSDAKLSNTAGSVSYTLPPGAEKLFTRLVVTLN